MRRLFSSYCHRVFIGEAPYLLIEEAISLEILWPRCLLRNIRLSNMTLPFLGTLVWDAGHIFPVFGASNSAVIFCPCIYLRSVGSSGWRIRSKLLLPISVFLLLLNFLITFSHIYIFQIISVFPCFTSITTAAQMLPCLSPSVRFDVRKFHRLYPPCLHMKRFSPCALMRNAIGCWSPDMTSMVSQHFATVLDAGRIWAVLVLFFATGKPLMPTGPLYNVRTTNFMHIALRKLCETI